MKWLWSKRRRWYWLAALVVLGGFGLWLEPTRVPYGWLRGETFYQGRPTSYWRGEMQQWRYGMGFAGGGVGWQREPNWLEQKFPEHFPRRLETPPFYPSQYQPSLKALLHELEVDSSPRVRRNVKLCLWATEEIRRNPQWQVGSFGIQFGIPWEMFDPWEKDDRLPFAPK